MTSEVKSWVLEAQNHLKVSNIRFELGRLKLILVFLTSILTSLTSEVKGHDVYLFRIIIGGHTPIFVKIGRPWVKLCSSKVKGLLTCIVTLGHCDKPSYRGALLLKIWRKLTTYLPRIFLVVELTVGLTHIQNTNYHCCPHFQLISL